MYTDNYIREKLDGLAEAVGRHLDAHTMAIIGPILFDADIKVRDAAERIAASQGYRRRLAVILQTYGGVVEVVERMVSVVRHHFDHVAFVIPDVAMSAGTIFALSGDEIWMDYSSCLGPIDPQIERDGKLVPALSYVAQFEALKKKAEVGQLTTPELLLLQKLDLADLHSYEEAKNLSIALLEDWLTRYKFKNWLETESSKQAVTEELRRARAKEIGRELNNHEKWHSHGRPISMECLQRQLNLKIDDLESNPDLHHAVREYYGLAIDYMNKTGQPHVVHAQGVYL